MDAPIDYLLEHGLQGLIVTRVTIAEWGQSLEIACVADAYGHRRPYRLHFQGCSHLSWEVLEGADVTEPDVDVLGFEIAVQRRGLKPHREGDDVAVLHTMAFELIISYTALTLEL